MSELCDGSQWEEGCSGPGWNSHLSPWLTKFPAEKVTQILIWTLMSLLSVLFLGHPPPKPLVCRAVPRLSIPLLPSSLEDGPVMERSWIPKYLLPFMIPHPRLAPRPCTLLPRRFQLPSTAGNTPHSLHTVQTTQFPHAYTHTLLHMLHTQAFTGSMMMDAHALAAISVRSG